MSVRIGASGAPVQQVQQALDRNGAHLDVDGRFGRLTESAVRQFQAEHHLHVDGVVGRETAAALGLSGDAFEPRPAPRRPSSANGGSPVSPGPSSPLGPPMDPRNAPGQNSLQKLTSLMRDEQQRLAYYHQQGLPVPPAETARAQRMLGIADQAGDVLPLATGEGGRDIADFGTARADLRDELNRR